MRLFDTNSAHPIREPRGGLAEFEPLPKVTHRPEAGQVDEVDAVSFGDSPHVAGPPPGRSREPVHEYDRVALPSGLEAYRPASHPYLAPRRRNPYRPTSPIRVARHRYLPERKSPIEDILAPVAIGPRALIPLVGLAGYRGACVRHADQHVRQPVAGDVSPEAEEPGRRGHERVLRRVEHRVRGHRQHPERAESVVGDQAVARPCYFLDAQNED